MMRARRRHDGTPSVLLVRGGEHAQVDEACQGEKQQLEVWVGSLSEVRLEVVPILEAQGATVSHHPCLGQCSHILIAPRVQHREHNLDTRASAEIADLAAACVRLQPFDAAGIEDLECEVATSPWVAKLPQHTSARLLHNNGLWPIEATASQGARPIDVEELRKMLSRFTFSQSLWTNVVV